MANRIEISTKVNDTRSTALQKNLQTAGYKIETVRVIDVYTVNKNFTPEQLEQIAKILHNPISQSSLIDRAQPDQFDQALEIGFLPGVTDNVATTAKESIEDLFKIKFTYPDESLHTSQLILIKGQVTAQQAYEIGETLANNLIQRITVIPFAEYQGVGMPAIVPKVTLQTNPHTDQVDLNVSEEELLKIGQQGIADKDGTRRGPLALDKTYLEAIKTYFNEVEKRPPNDIELESIAQTWSEHCKHTIFADPIDEVQDGLYKTFIKGATNKIRQQKGDKDFCVSVFSDNSGGIIFDENWVITDKAETHNSPSALDPFGGAVTGIVGVNRDCLGFGKGAKPIINKYGFCVGNPDDNEPIYRDADRTTKTLSPKRILEGVVAGVNSGGNCSGISTPQGFVVFDDSYKGKPLVFAGTIGLIPKKINGKPSWEKSAQVGDNIVIIGGRVGQDGIHGATFSSEALTAGSPATAVQIGDPITQKKLSDALVKEARDLELYSSITDCGAGGISCSIAEMAKECGGCEVDLNKVPLKYPNLEPWKIWISESQERMTLAVPDDKLAQFQQLMAKRGVEVSVLGKFTNSGRCVVKYDNAPIMDIQMEFLHNGLPKKQLTTTYTKPTHAEPTFQEPTNLNETFTTLLARPNIASFEFISKQYDHSVQGGAVIGPLQGRGRVNGVASVTRPLLDSKKGVVCSQGINPNYSEIDTYHMSACAIDTAIRNVIAVGGPLDHLAIMDNYCWCSSNEPERLGQLKASLQACYDYAVAYETPYISGKDSMFNDFKGFDANGQPVKISIKPTLLISAIAVINDVTKSVSLDAKLPGDLIYLLGDTHQELGGSEYYAMHNAIGNKVPQVNAPKAIELYKRFNQATENRLIASAISPSIGGLAAAISKMSIAGQLGLHIDLAKIATTLERNDEILFSESQSRFLVTVAPQNKEAFEQLFQGQPIAQIGQVTDDQTLKITSKQGQEILNLTVEQLTNAYKKTFKDY